MFLTFVVVFLSFVSDVVTIGTGILCFCCCCFYLFCFGCCCGVVMFLKHLFIMFSTKNKIVFLKAFVVVFVFMLYLFAQERANREVQTLN